MLIILTILIAILILLHYFTLIKKLRKEVEIKNRALDIISRINSKLSAEIDHELLIKAIKCLIEIELQKINNITVLPIENKECLIK
jgi:hypothetical protein